MSFGVPSPFSCMLASQYSASALPSAASFSRTWRAMAFSPECPASTAHESCSAGVPGCSNPVQVDRASDREPADHGQAVNDRQDIVRDAAVLRWLSIGLSHVRTSWPRSSTIRCEGPIESVAWLAHPSPSRLPRVSSSRHTCAGGTATLPSHQRASRRPRVSPPPIHARIQRPIRTSWCGRLQGL
jgi:hypothetical protein